MGWALDTLPHPYLVAGHTEPAHWQALVAGQCVSEGYATEAEALVAAKVEHYRRLADRIMAASDNELERWAGH
jgi:hypothetical protein